MYQDAYYSDGRTLNLASTDFNDYGMIGRAAYEVSPILKPFVEGTYDTRMHNRRSIPTGYYRDSEGRALRAGAEVKISDLLHGQASGGDAERDYQDVRLPQLRGPTVDAALIYTPTPLTTLTLRGATTLDETNSPALRARFHAHRLGVGARSAPQPHGDGARNLFQQPVSGRFAGGKRLHRRREARLQNHALNRVPRQHSHERLGSNEAGDDYTANVFLVGLRFQQ